VRGFTPSLKMRPGLPTILDVGRWHVRTSGIPEWSALALVIADHLVGAEGKSGAVGEKPWCLARESPLVIAGRIAGES
jgi:hypothetical protein